jgi:hypothetical protein
MCLLQQWWMEVIDEMTAAAIVNGVPDSQTACGSQVGSEGKQHTHATEDVVVKGTRFGLKTLE